MKIEPTVAAIATAEAAKAQPSWSVTASRAAKITAITARTSTGWGTSGPPATLRVQITQPTDQAIAAQPSGRRRRGLARVPASVVRSFRNVAPCSRHSAEQRHPGPQPIARQQVEEVAREVMTESIGSPWSRSPSPTPSSSGISRLPSVVHHIHVRRQR